LRQHLCSLLHFGIGHCPHDHVVRQKERHPTRNQLKQVFDALRELMTPPDPPKRPIGFVTHDEKKSKG